MFVRRPLPLLLLAAFLVSQAMLTPRMILADDAPPSDDPPAAGEETAATDDSEKEAAAEQAQPPAKPANAFRKAEKKIDDAFGKVNGYVATVFFYPIPLPARSPVVDDSGEQKLGENGEKLWKTATMPAAVLWLVAGAIFFTVRMGFINVRGFKHAVLVTAGRYDNPEDEGEVSHFQALTAALSATVGLGNIAGVAIAVSVGGAGATFWMILAGFLGMSSKFVECTLGQKYRSVRPDGRVLGGPMAYLSNGLKEMGLGPLGAVLAVVFAVLCIGGSFAGGNAFQVSQSLDAIGEIVPFLDRNTGNPWVYGLVMTLMVAIVIIGGIRRIAQFAEKIVPTMCGIYVLAALAILVMNASQIPAAFSTIVSQAFAPAAIYGGAIGVLVQGFKRAAFSNEAGVGSAAIAHSAAKTDHPVREGTVALLGPFIDTVVICTMTALVLVITNAYNDPQYAEFVAKNQGAALTSRAMDSVLPGFRFVLGVAVVLFAYSTMISWSYYGERCWAFLFGDGASLSYRIVFLVFTFLGSIVSATNVLDFGDLMILGMAFPNVLGVVLLSGKVKQDLDVYWAKYKAGEFEPKDTPTSETAVES